MRIRGPALTAIVATLAVGVLCLVPIPQAAEGIGPPASDKYAHVLLFGGLAVLWWRVVPGRSWLVGVAVALYGGLLELLQGLTVYRACDVVDFLADALGAALALGGVALGLWFRARAAQRLQGSNRPAG